MKRILITLTLVLAIVGSLLFRSCSESKEDSDGLVQENIVLFEDLSMLENVSSNPLENHIYRIELLGSGESYEDLLSALEEQEVDLSHINIQGVKKHYMNHSEVLMYSLPYNTSDKMLIVYQYDDIFQVVLTSVRIQENGNQEYRLSTMDGRLYYGMTINSSDEAGEFIRGNNPEMQVFSDNVSRLSIGHGVEGRSELKIKDDDTCCRQMEDWKACFDCTMTFFSTRWYGLLAIAAIGPEFVASVGISCIGARPTAVC